MLEDENQRLLDRFSSLEDSSSSSKRPQQQQQQNQAQSQDHTLSRQPSFKWANFVKPAKSPTKPTLDAAISDSPRSSPQAMEHDVPVRAYRLTGRRQHLTAFLPASTLR